MAMPIIGLLSPQFCEVMNDIQAFLRYLFQTQNEATFCVSGAGHSAMEVSIMNVIEPGDTLLVGCNGLWGERVSRLGERLGANVKGIQVPAGEGFELSQIENGLREHRPKALFLTHGESSMGVLQPLEGVGALCHKYGCLLVVDTVCTLGGYPLLVDKWEVDVAYSGSQKCLSCPTGASPITFSPRAMEAVKARRTQVPSFYFDVLKIAEYWGIGGGPRKYHHTGLTSTYYALREALATLVEEGLEAAWARHAKNARFLYSGLAKLGLKLHVQKEKFRLPTVTLVTVPPGVDWKRVRDYMDAEFDVEILGGLPPLAGQVWRIGLMGYNCTEVKAAAVLHALEASLAHFGHRTQAHL